MFNFPSSPTVGQKYSPGAGVPTYRWDGEKWTKDFTAQAGPFDGNPSMDGVPNAGISTLYARSDHVHPSDTGRGAINNSNFTGTLTAELVNVSGNVTVN